MPNFAPDQVTFDDGPGMGLWDIGHAREHLQFVQVLGAQTPVINFPDFDFIQMLTAGDARKSIWETHSQAHSLLRQITGVGGFDYSGYDLTKQDGFYQFTQDHAVEHSALRAALGITT